jgi:hypothetical protein
MAQSLGAAALQQRQAAAMIEAACRAYHGFAWEIMPEDEAALLGEHAACERRGFPDDAPQTHRQSERVRMGRALAAAWRATGAAGATGATGAAAAFGTPGAEAVDARPDGGALRLDAAAAGTGRRQGALLASAGPDQDCAQ